MSICPISTGFHPTDTQATANKNLCYVHITANTTELLKTCCGDEELETVGWDGGDLCYVAATCRTGGTAKENEDIKEDIESCFATRAKEQKIGGTHGCLFAKLEDDGESGSEKLRLGGWIGLAGLVSLWVAGGF